MPQPVEIGTRKRKRVRLTPEGRSTHLHVMGASGKGKSKALEQLIRQDIRAGHGVCVIDPHGTLYEDVVKWCAEHAMYRHRKIHLINPGSTGSTVGFNPLWVREDEDISRRVDRVVEALEKVWGGEDLDARPRLSKVLTCICYALAARNLTLIEASELLSTSNQDGLREHLSANLENALFKRLWDDLNSLPAKTLHEYFESTDSRFVKFLASPTVQAMLGSCERPIDFRKCMDNDEIVLINLQETGHLSAKNASVIGALISNELFSLASSRPRSVADRHPFYFYMDECYRFLSGDITDMLNQTRKRGLHVTLAHHYLSQLKDAGDSVYDAVMTNAQTKMIFGGTSDKDAETLAYEMFRTEFDLNQAEDLLSKPNATGEFRRETVHGGGEASATTTGTSITVGTSSGVGASFAQSFDGTGVSGGYVEGTSSIDVDISSSSEIEMQTEASTSSWNETLVPEYAIMPTALKSIDKVVHEAIVRLRKLGPQFAILKQPDKRSVYVKIKHVRAATVTEGAVDEFVDTVIERSEYTLPRPLALREIEERRKRLVAEASGQTLIEEDEEDFLQ